MQSIQGNGEKVVAVVVYGNRDYDDALIELCDTVSAQGFEVVAAAAFIAQHCIFLKVANGRPDAEDINKIAEFTTLVKSKLQKGSTLDISLVKGNRPSASPEQCLCTLMSTRRNVTDAALRRIALQNGRPEIRERQLPPP